MLLLKLAFCSFAFSSRTYFGRHYFLRRLDLGGRQLLLPLLSNLPTFSSLAFSDLSIIIGSVCIYLRLIRSLDGTGMVGRGMIDELGRLFSQVLEEVHTEHQGYWRLQIYSMSGGYKYTACQALIIYSRLVLLLKRSGPREFGPDG